MVCRWVGSHYPVWAIGSAAPTGIRKRLRPLLRKWEAHYLSGHQHDLEHIVEADSTVIVLMLVLVLALVIVLVLVLFSCP